MVKEKRKSIFANKRLDFLGLSDMNHPAWTPERETAYWPVLFYTSVVDKFPVLHVAR